MELTVQELKRRLARTTPVGEWFDMGRVDRLEWRSGPHNIAVVAVEWSYSKDEWVLRLLRKVVVRRPVEGDGRVGVERYIWTGVSRVYVKAATEARDLEEWDRLVKQTIRNAQIGEPEMVARRVEISEALPGADAEATRNPREGRW